MSIKLRIIEPYISKYVHVVDDYNDGIKFCCDEIKKNNLTTINILKIKNINNGKIITIKLNKKEELVKNNENELYNIVRELEYKIDKLNQKVELLVETKVNKYHESEQKSIKYEEYKSTKYEEKEIPKKEIPKKEIIKDDLCNIM